jgi:hypothetical protein
MRLWDTINYIDKMTVLCGNVVFPDGEYMGYADRIDNVWHFTRTRWVVANDNKPTETTP